MRTMLLVVLAVAMTVACGPQHPPTPAPPPCETLQARCDGTVVQLCDADGAWASVEDCARTMPTAGQCTPTGCTFDLQMVAAVRTREVLGADVVLWAVHLQRALVFELHNSLDPNAPIAALNDWLARLGILEADAYRSRFAATIGRAVFVPFALGEPRGAWDVPAQFRVLGHEATHVLQATPDLPGFAWRYLTRQAARVLIEAEAYAADAEIGWQLWRAPPNPDAVAASLESYLLRDRDRAFAHRYITLRAQTITANGYSSRACVESLAFGRARGLL